MPESRAKAESGPRIVKLLRPPPAPPQPPRRPSERSYYGPLRRGVFNRLAEYHSQLVCLDLTVSLSFVRSLLNIRRINQFSARIFQVFLLQDRVPNPATHNVRLHSAPCHGRTTHTLLPVREHMPSTLVLRPDPSFLVWPVAYIYLFFVLAARLPTQSR